MWAASSHRITTLDPAAIMSVCGADTGNVDPARDLREIALREKLARVMRRAGRTGCCLLTGGNQRDGHHRGLSLPVAFAGAAE
jgi:hypothetical protein